MEQSKREKDAQTNDATLGKAHPGEVGQDAATRHIEMLKGSDLDPHDLSKVTTHDTHVIHKSYTGHTSLWSPGVAMGCHCDAYLVENLFERFCLLFCFMRVFDVKSVKEASR